MGSQDLFTDSNEHLHSVVKSLATLVTRPDMINVDYEDIKVVMQYMGLSTVGYSFQEGESRAKQAI
ncbi:hypothetical protein [Vibrio sp. MA40-2]|uniref:hypothetical protein n=1 Tax=Vibrio sp. MA40-2 TaxID=3391828 RepID=UPI0039A75546